MLNFTILNDVDLYISKNYLMPQSVKKYDTNKNDRNVTDYRYLELSNKYSLKDNLPKTRFADL